jgi:hemolysin III
MISPASESSHPGPVKLSAERPNIAAGRPVPAARAIAGEISWNYDRTEILADAIVHATGLMLGLIGAVAIIAFAAKAHHVEVVPVTVYVTGLMTMLILSAAYNLWPVSPAKWILRRFDHSAIYLLIAGTYTPFLAQMKSGLASVGLGVGLWVSAAVGVFLKLALPGRFDRAAIVLCLLLGWSGVVAYEAMVAAIPSISLWLLAAGGLLYTVGTLFHVCESLRFQNAIWHFFVLLASICHYFAVFASLSWR